MSWKRKSFLRFQVKNSKLRPRTGEWLVYEPYATRIWHKKKETNTLGIQQAEFLFPLFFFFCGYVRSNSMIRRTKMTAVELVNPEADENKYNVTMNNCK